MTSDINPPLRLTELEVEEHVQVHSVTIQSSPVSLTPGTGSDRAPSYESLRRIPVINYSKQLSREERLSLFWESLDKDVNMEAPNSKPARVLGIPSQPQLQEPLAPQKLLRQQRSSIITQTNSRLSQLVSFSTLSLGIGTQTNKLRRPRSTPAFSHPRQHPNVIMRSGISSSSNKFGNDWNSEYELPSGIKQIGSGIGFTYAAPAASRTKSKSSLAGATNSCIGRHSLERLPVIGRLRIGSRAFGGGGNGILRLRSKSKPSSRREFEGQTGPEYRQRMNSVPEDVVGEVETEKQEQDVFRYGSTWSLMPEPGDACCRVRVHSESEQVLVSPVTATESTAYSPPLPLTEGFASPSLSPLQLEPGSDSLDGLGIVRRGFQLSTVKVK